MRRKRTFLLMVAVGLSVAVLAPEAAVAAPKPVVVGTDPVGDWGGNAAAPVGAELGQDLVKASMVMADKTSLNFILEVTSLPPIGGVPEATRYNWSMAVDGQYVELTGAFTEYLRAVCNPLSGGCPGTNPPRDPGMQPFFVRGNCSKVQGVFTCQEIGLVHATFDASAATITIPVPLTLLGAKPGSKIAPAPAFFPDGSIWAAPGAFVVSGAAPHDSMLVTKTFVVPGGKKKKKK